jgi:hypothetical protein
MLDQLQDCYRTLDLEPGANPDEVKRSYRELVKVWHPDRFNGDPRLQIKADEKLKQINLAYERICKCDTASSRRPTGSTRQDSSGSGENDKQAGQKTHPGEAGHTKEKSPPPEADHRTQENGRSKTTSQKVPKWSHAAIGFGFMTLSLWLVPNLWDDFSQYERTGRISTTRIIFLLYQLLGKQGVIAFFCLFGIFMGYLGISHARALFAGHQQIALRVRKWHMRVTALLLGFFVLIGDRPGRRAAQDSFTSTTPTPNIPVSQPYFARPKSPEVLTIDEIAELYREALKRNPNLKMSLREFSQFAQDKQKEYDFSAGISYHDPTEVPRYTEEYRTPAVERVASLTNIMVAQEESQTAVAPEMIVNEEDKSLELVVRFFRFLSGKLEGLG